MDVGYGSLHYHTSTRNDDSIVVRFAVHWWFTVSVSVSVSFSTVNRGLLDITHAMY